MREKKEYGEREIARSAFLEMAMDCGVLLLAGSEDAWVEHRTLPGH